MPTRSRSEVEEIKKVQNQQGEKANPANEAQQKRVAQAVENQDSLSAGTYLTSSTNVEQLPGESIPEGVKVSIQAQNGNTGAVFVGTDSDTPIRLAPNNSINLAVTDLSLVHIQTPNSGDGVAYIYEG